MPKTRTRRPAGSAIGDPSTRLVGLVPAAGRARRLGRRAGSKELARIRSGAGELRPVAESLLEAMAEAGVEVAFTVLRDGKWDIPAHFSRPGPLRRPPLAYLVTPGTESVPETLDLAYPFVRDAQVAFGFPDVRIRPRSALAEVVAAARETASDLTLGLFPSRQPDKTDMVELDGERITGFRVKPGACELEYTWLLATWGPRFSRFLHDRLAAPDPARPVGGRLAEQQVSEVFAAALGAGLTVGARRFPDGTFIDVGTPEDLERARE